MKKHRILNCVKRLVFYCLAVFVVVAQADKEVQILDLTFSPLAEDAQGYRKYKCSGCQAEVFRYTREGSKKCLLAIHAFSDKHDGHAYTYKRIKQGNCFFYRKRSCEENDAGWCEQCGLLISHDAMELHLCSDLPEELKNYRFPPPGYTYGDPGTGDTEQLKPGLDGNLPDLPTLLFFVQSAPLQAVYQVQLERRSGVGNQYEWICSETVEVVSADKFADYPPCLLSSACCFEGCIQYGFSNPLDKAAEEFSDQSFWIDSAGNVKILQGTYKRSRVEQQVREDFCREELPYYQLPVTLRDAIALSYCKQKDYDGGWGGTDAPNNRTSICQLDKNHTFVVFRDDIYCYDAVSLHLKPTKCIALPTKKDTPWWYMQEPLDICSVWNPERNEHDIYISMGPTQKESHKELCDQMRFLRFPASDPENLSVPEWGGSAYYYFFWNYCLRTARAASGEIRLFYLRQPLLRRREHKPEHVRLVMVKNPHLLCAEEQVIPKPEGHLAISAIYPSPDGRFLLAFHPDDYVSIYDLDSEEWIAHEPIVQGNPTVRDFSVGLVKKPGVSGNGRGQCTAEL